MPPSSNHQYLSIVRKGKPLRIPARELQDFRKEVEQWRLVNLKSVLLVRKQLELVKYAQAPIEVRCQFYFACSSILTLAGAPKKLDVSNRLKALHDSVAELIDYDDKYFWRISAEKFSLDQGPAYVDVEIRTM